MAAKSITECSLPVASFVFSSQALALDLTNFSSGHETEKVMEEAARVAREAGVAPPAAQNQSTNILSIYRAAS